MDYDAKAREIADGLAGYIAEPRRTELAQDIAAALTEAQAEGMEKAASALDAKADEMSKCPNDYSANAIVHVRTCAAIVRALSGK